MAAIPSLSCRHACVACIEHAGRSSPDVDALKSGVADWRPTEHEFPDLWWVPSESSTVFDFKQNSTAKDHAAHSMSAASLPANCNASDGNSTTRRAECRATHGAPMY